MKKEIKEGIERLCDAFIRSLSGEDGLKDSLHLKNLIDDAFKNDLTEKMYAYRYCHNILKENLNAFNTD